MTTQVTTVAQDTTFDYGQRSRLKTLLNKLWTWSEYTRLKMITFNEPIYGSMRATKNNLSLHYCWCCFDRLPHVFTLRKSAKYIRAHISKNHVNFHFIHGITFAHFGIGKDLTVLMVCILLRSTFQIGRNCSYQTVGCVMNLETRRQEESSRLLDQWRV